LDLKICSLRDCGQLCFNRLKVNVVNGRALPRDAVMVHRIDAVGGDVHLEDGFFAFSLNAFYSDASEGEIIGELARLDLEIDPFTQPVGTDSHANCSRNRMSP